MHLTPIPSTCWSKTFWLNPLVKGSARLSSDAIWLTATSPQFTSWNLCLIENLSQCTQWIPDSHLGKPAIIPCSPKILEYMLYRYPVFFTRFWLIYANHAYGKIDIQSCAQHCIHETSHCRSIGNPSLLSISALVLGCWLLDTDFSTLKGTNPFLESCMLYLVRISSI